MSEAYNGNMLEGANNRPRPILVISPKEFLFKYIRYLPWIIGSVLLFCFFAYIKIRYTTQIYEVKASLLIKNDNSLTGSSKDQRFSDLFMEQDNINLDNEIQILKSRPIIGRVINDLHLQYSVTNKGKVRSNLLYPDAPFNLRILRLADSSKGMSLKITILNDSSFLLNDGKKPIAFGQMLEEGNNKFYLERNFERSIESFGSMEFQASWQPVSAVVENIIGSLKVVQENDRATILSLVFDSENQDLAKDIVNKLMSVYDSLGVEGKNRISYNTLKFIDARLDELSDTVKGIQSGLKNFMVENDAYDIETQAKGFMERIDDVASKKNEQAVRLHIVDWLLQYIRDKDKTYELVPTNLGIEEPGLILLVEQYNRLQLERENNLKTTNPENPLIKGLEVSLEKVRQNIEKTLSHVRQAYLIADQSIQQNKDALVGHIKALPGKSIRMLNIQRQQKIFEDLYSLLLQKKIETSIASASTISNSQVIEPAIGSGAPISPSVKKIYSFYLMLGVLIPIGIIALKEVMQDKVNSRMDIEKQIATPIIGEVGHSAEAKALVITPNSRRFISEQFRIIRTNLQYVVGKQENPTILVTSSFSGEGKSFIGTNIGAVMALTGKKTVIMEFDIRKPKILSGLDLKRKSGITNYIIGRATIDDVIVKVAEVDNLYVIPCGPIPPNPAELLLEGRLAKLIEEVKERFEVVIMDTAPVGLVSDAINLAKFADCTLFIVRQRYTFRRQLAFIGELYDMKKLPGLCIVINDVNPENGYYGGSYGSYGYYGYSYGSDSGYFEKENVIRRTFSLRWLFRKAKMGKR